MKIIFTDIETTGLTSKRNSDGFRNEIIEVAAVLFDTDTMSILDTFEELIKPRHSIPGKVTQITGITNFTVMRARTEKEVLTDFTEWVHMCNADFLCAHNASFEKRFYNDIMADLHLNWVKLDYIDTLKLAKQYDIPTAKTTGTGRKSFSQESIAEALGINYKAHRAMPDTMAMIEIYKFIYNKYLNKSTKQKRDDLGF